MIAAVLLAAAMATSDGQTTDAMDAGHGHMHHMSSPTHQVESHQMEPSHHHHAHQMNADGMVMNANDSVLPRDCQEISEDVSFEIMAGTEFAHGPGDTFGMSQHNLEAQPCSRITVTFMNHDDIRHQWMVHGLPRYLYPGGMFHLEANGGAAITGTFIVPSDRKTYLVHCDMSQHMEKGMKAQLKVGGGDGDLWSIPGISENYIHANDSGLTIGQALGAALLAFVVVLVVPRWRRKGP